MSKQKPEPELLVIVDSVEQSTMASNWTEHLCLFRLPDGLLVFEIRCFQAVGDADEFWNEDTEENDLPDKIGEHDVIGIEDGQILISNLVRTGNYSSNYVFRDFSWDDYKGAFASESPEFCTLEVKDKIEKALSEIVDS